MLILRKILFVFLSLCHVVFADEVHMHVTEKTTFADVCRFFRKEEDKRLQLPGRKELEFRLLIENESVRAFPIYCGIMCPTHTLFKLQIQNDGNIYCACACINGIWARKVEELERFRNTQSRRSEVILKYIEDISDKVTVDDYVVEFVIYPESFDIKINQYMELFYNLTTMFPYATVYLHIEDRP